MTSAQHCSLDRLTYQGSARDVNHWSWTTMSEAACSCVLNHSQQCCWIVENVTLICLVWLFLSSKYSTEGHVRDAMETSAFCSGCSDRYVIISSGHDGVFFSHLEILYLSLSYKTELNISRPTNWLTLFYLNRWLLILHTYILTLYILSVNLLPLIFLYLRLYLYLKTGCA